MCYLARFDGEQIFFLVLNRGCRALYSEKKISVLLFFAIFAQMS